MRRLRLVPISILLTLLTVALGCENTGTVGVDGGTPPADGGGVDTDGGPAPMALVYTPEGCGYPVTVPALPCRGVMSCIRDSGRMGTALGASPAPGFVHASFAGPTDTTFAINWRTDVDTSVSQILYGTDEAAVAAADMATGGVMLTEGHHVLFHPIDGAGEDSRLHEAHLCGLSPSTTYYYKVGGPGAWSEVYDLATAPSAGAADAFRFAVAGDSRNDAIVWAQTQQAIQAAAPDFQIFSGDAVVLGANQPEWDGFFGQTIDTFDVQDVLARIPLMPANGNHDGLAINYVLQFALPQDETPGERAQGEEWYSFDYANAHFVVLNDSAGNSLIEGAQRDWLRADLMAVDRTATPWVFAVHHIPAYSCSTNHGSNIPLRNAWQPVYDEFEVDVVFNGHDHDYERSLPIRGIRDGSTDGIIAEAGTNGIPVNGSGTVYVVAAGAGAPLYGVDTCYHTQVTESTRNYVVVDIDGKTLHYTAYRLDGTVLDEFEYTKM